MKTQVSPVMAGVVVFCIVVVAGIMLWRSTGSGGRRELTPEVKAHLMHSGGAGPGAPASGLRLGGPPAGNR